MIQTDYLPGIDKEIFQEEEMYHFNSDTVLLGAFLDLKHSDTVLDIGVNNGAVLLYASRFQVKSLEGIDVFEEVLQLAQKNMEHHHLDATFHCMKVQEFKGKQYDVITCNPPYFNTENEALKSLNTYKKTARHEENLTLEDLFESVARLLKENGRFYLVHRASELNRILQTASKFHLYPKRMRFAYGSKTTSGKSVTIEFTFSNKRQVQIDPPCFLNEKETFFYKK